MNQQKILKQPPIITKEDRETLKMGALITITSVLLAWKLGWDMNSAFKNGLYLTNTYANV